MPRDENGVKLLSPKEGREFDSFTSTPRSETEMAAEWAKIAAAGEMKSALRRIVSYWEESQAAVMEAGSEFEQFDALIERGKRAVELYLNADALRRGVS